MNFDEPEVKDPAYVTVDGVRPKWRRSGRNGRKLNRILKKVYFKSWIVSLAHIPSARLGKEKVIIKNIQK